MEEKKRRQKQEIKDERILELQQRLQSKKEGIYFAICYCGQLKYQTENRHNTKRARKRSNGNWDLSSLLTEKIGLDFLLLGFGHEKVNWDWDF